MHLQPLFSVELMSVVGRSNVLSDDDCGIIDFKIQLQLRLCLCETSSEQSDVFPSSVSINVNGSTCLLQVGTADLYHDLSENGFTGLTAIKPSVSLWPGVKCVEY